MESMLSSSSKEPQVIEHLEFWEEERVRYSHEKLYMLVNELISKKEDVPDNYIYKTPF